MMHFASFKISIWLKRNSSPTLIVATKRFSVIRISVKPSCDQKLHSWVTALQCVTIHQSLPPSAEMMRRGSSRGASVELFKQQVWSRLLSLHFVLTHKIMFFRGRNKNVSDRKRLSLKRSFYKRQISGDKRGQSGTIKKTEIMGCRAPRLSLPLATPISNSWTQTLIGRGPLAVSARETKPRCDWTKRPSARSVCKNALVTAAGRRPACLLPGELLVSPSSRLRASRHRWWVSLMFFGFK